MNGRYALAETPEERMAIATVAAIHSYFQQHPQGVAPGQGFLADYLKPFIERELLETRLDEHRLARFGKSGRQRELLEALHRTMRECSERIQHTSFRIACGSSTRRYQDRSSGAETSGVIRGEDARQGVAGSACC